MGCKGSTNNAKAPSSTQRKPTAMGSGSAAPATAGAQTGTVAKPNTASSAPPASTVGVVKKEEAIKAEGEKKAAVVSTAAGKTEDAAKPAPADTKDKVDKSEEDDDADDESADEDDEDDDDDADEDENDEDDEDDDEDEDDEDDDDEEEE